MRDDEFGGYYDYLDYVFHTPSDPGRSVECVAQRCELIHKNEEFLKQEKMIYFPSTTDSLISFSVSLRSKSPPSETVTRSS